MDRTSSAPRISVVIGSVESARSIEACLDSIVRACRDLPAEILLVDASIDATRDIAHARFPAVRVLNEPAGTLTPDLWARGIRESRGRWVALSTGHCIVPEGWAEALLAGVEGKAAGGGAGLGLADDTGVVDWAVYYLRYASFARADGGPDRPIDDVPGDNAIYEGTALRASLAGSPGGFWEVEYHHALRREGKQLRWIPDARVRFGRSFPLGTIVRARFAHGRHFGGWRARHGGRGPLAAALAAPLVPLVLFARTARAVLPIGGHALRFVLATPVFLLLAAAWALGEVAGAMER